MPQRTEHGRQRNLATLESAWCADAEQCPDHEPEIETARVDKQALEYVHMPTDLRPSEPTGLVEVCTQTLEQFAALTQKPSPMIPPDTPAIRVDRRLTRSRRDPLIAWAVEAR